MITEETGSRDGSRWASEGVRGYRDNLEEGVPMPGANDG